MFATTTVAVYRDTDPDPLGDTDDDDRMPVPGLDRVAVALTERSRTVYDQAASELRTIRTATLRPIDSRADIRRDDRVRDNASGTWWLVREGSGGGRDAVGMRTVSFELRGT